MIYTYLCDCCEEKWEESRKVSDRYLPTTLPCSKCGEMSVIKVPDAPMIKVPEGALGNAENGYSSTHGDAENFKAKSKGEPLPYPTSGKNSIYNSYN